MSRINIAIDGPSGAGKTTIAKTIAKRHGFLYLDTGAIYRAVGYYVMKQGIDSQDKNGIMRVIPGAKIELQYKDGAQHVLLNGEDVSDLIRTPLVSKYASDVSAVEGVRTYLLGLQRSIAQNNDCILDGRDIGTVVLPDAGLKIYLTASPRSRALRRYNELVAAGEITTLDQVLEDMVYRDQNDSTRTTAPLKSAPDAVILDSTELSLDETIDAVDFIIKDRFSDVL